ncbi:acetaldehyde dehydrogenase (acetylating) [Faecousia sp.]|uniref:acetaldehyde dehydrogenase (acetylating) n=1 Tax=Faecousia sp. TaxID=2952921 RepID=UPI003AF8A9F9
MEFDRDLRARQEVRLLAQQAQQAFEGLQKLDQSGLDRITEALSRAGALHAAELARGACAETGFGNERDKTEKNRFAAVRVFGAIRGLRTVGILRRDDERRVWDVGVPVGVIAGIVPSTNPTSTVIYKSLIALKAGSPIVFSPHPHAVRCTLHAARLMAEAAEAAGCPKGAISCLTMPSLDAVQELLHAPQVRLILATGGGAMVRAAYSSGKPAIGVGAGNGPAYIHRSADIPRAVRDILRSKTFDNGTVCASEQSVIVERCCEARVREEFRKQGCYFLNTEEAGRVARLLLRPDGTINPKVVGRTACAVARMAGVTVPESTPVLLANETEAGPARPYSREKLCPILAFFVEEDEDTILRRICEVLAGEGAGHTFVLHAKDEAVVRRFALTVPVSRFLVNVPASLGGIGAETALFPALTLGCGAVGGSSSSNNIGPLDLINLRRVAWGSEKPEPQPETPDQPEPDSALIARLTEEILKKLR